MPQQPVARAAHQQQPVARTAMNPEKVRTPAQAPVWQSTAPVAMSVPPMAIPAPRGRAGRFVIGLGAVASLLLILARNDALLSVANATKQGQAYLDTERRAFGGPLFGTPRAVEKLLAETGGPLEPVQSPVVAVRLSDPEPTAPVAARPATAQATSSSTALQKGASASGNPLGGNVAAALLGQPAKAKGSPAAQRQAAPAPSPRKKPASNSSRRTVSGSTNYYDPLNGAL
jgi:hypothetical protein